MSAALLALQDRFQGFLMQDDIAIVEDVVGSADIDPRRRLGIYYDAYRSRLVEALRTDYTALPILMGEAAFEQAALAFIVATPSRHRNLRWYGGALPAHLQESAGNPPWLAELAAFEWTITLAFDAPDHDSLTFEQMAALDPAAWPTVRFVLHPSLHRLSLHSNAPTLRKAVDEGEAVPAPQWQETPVQWLLWRSDYTVMYRSMPAEEAWALDAARDGMDFTGLCEGLCQWVAPEAAAGQMAGMLRAWVDEGLVAGLEA